MVDTYVRLVAAEHSAAEAQEALARLPALHAKFSQSVNHLYTYLQSSRLQVGAGPACFGGGPACLEGGAARWLLCSVLLGGMQDAGMSVPRCSANLCADASAACCCCLLLAFYSGLLHAAFCMHAAHFAASCCLLHA